MKKNNIIICPFNSNHKIQSSKLDNHFYKSHPKELKNLLYCVNNASCKFLKKDLQNHLDKCSDCRKKYSSDSINDSSINSSISKKMIKELTFIKDTLNVTQEIQKLENEEESTNNNIISGINETKIL